MCRRIVLRVVEKVQQQQQKGQEENQICWRRDITHNTYTGGGGGFYEHVSYPQLQKARHVGNGVGVSCHRGVLCWRLWQPHSIVCQVQLHSPALMMEMAVVAKISKPQFCFSVCIFTLWTIWLMTTMETITSKRGKHRLSKCLGWSCWQYEVELVEEAVVNFWHDVKKFFTMFVSPAAPKFVLYRKRCDGTPVLKAQAFAVLWSKERWTCLLQMRKETL